MTDAGLLGGPSGCTADSPSSGAGARHGRVIGVDAARGIALFGMIMVHIFPSSGTSFLATAAEVGISGRAAALFAVLAGVGIALSTGGRTPFSGVQRRGAAAGLLVRASALFVLGLALHFGAHPPVSVILDYYGIMFAAAIPLLGLRPAVIWRLAAVWCVAGPVLSQLIRTDVPALAGRETLHGPLGDLALLAVTGTFPVMSWMTYVLVGLAVGRSGVGSPGVGARLLAGGTLLALAASGISRLLLGPLGGGRALALVGAGERALHRPMEGVTPTDSWWWLCVTAPHSSTPLDLAHTTGSALAVLGACLLLAERVRRPVRALAVVGSIPLTLYAVHIILLGSARAAAPYGSLLQLTLQLVVVAVIAAVVRWTGRRGPLEAMLTALAGTARHAVLNGIRTGRSGRCVVKEIHMGSAHTGNDLAGVTMPAGCRGCGSDAVQPVVDLGERTAADHFPPADDTTEDARWPLQLWLCPGCSLVQLGPVRPLLPEVPLAVESATSLAHAGESVRGLLAAHPELAGATVAEFASHHGGSWLPELRAAGCRVAADEDEAELVVDVHGLVHEPDIGAELRRRVARLAPGGLLLLEFHHLLPLVEECQFDTIRHGHWAYFSLEAVRRLVAPHGLRVVGVNQVPMFGGSLQVLLRHGDPDAALDDPVEAVLRAERAAGVADPVRLADLQSTARRSAAALRGYLAGQRDRGRTVLGYGAPSKAPVLLDVAGVGPELLPFVVDAAPGKHGRRIPGVGVPIRPITELRAARPDVVLILTWDIADEVISQLESSGGWGAEYVVPMPGVRRIWTSPAGRVAAALAGGAPRGFRDAG